MTKPNLSSLIERGLRRPAKIPRYVFGALVPSSEWGATWRSRDGVVRFEPGGYVSSPRNRPEYAANLYYEVSSLESVLADRLDASATAALEVGSGYGRLSPWIARRTETHLGIDPDERAVRRSKTLYPDLEFALGRAESIPCEDGAVDLLVAWTVLQHVPNSSIRDAAAEVRRVLAPEGLFVACERVRPPADDHLTPRSVATYEELFAPLELLDVVPRSVEPTWSRSMPTATPPERLLVFRS